MTNDLVKRLRTMAGIGWNPIGDEAADHIEKLELDLHFQKLQKVEWACYACIEKSESDAARIEKLTADIREYVNRTQYGDTNNIQRRMDRAVLLKIVENKND
jgi:hypothetical protein